MIELVDIARDEDKEFLDRPLKEQREAVNKLSKEAVGFQEGIQPIITPMQTEL